MSLSNLKRKLAASLRPAPHEDPVPPDELARALPDDDQATSETEDDFEGEGWSFWGV
jgi:hypothetical protein